MLLTCINGARVGTTSDHGDPELLEIYPEAQPMLKPGAQITIAAHITNKKVAATDITLGTVAAP